MALYMKRDRRTTTACEHLCDLVIQWNALPLALTDESPRRWLRMLGLVCFIPWVIPATLLSFPLMFVAMCGEIIEDAWRDPQ